MTEPRRDGADGGVEATLPVEWGRLLSYLQEVRGFDFHGYKHSSLMRRVHKRMEEVRVADFAEYQDFLEVHPTEFEALFNTILINVTAFFRDPPTWDVLANSIVPGIIARKRADEPLRFWSAGCASGEEAYTLAIVVAEALGPEEYRERVKIYATDVDDEALATARHATYDSRHVQGVPAPILEKYFDRVDDLFTFRKDLRRALIFGRHDLLQDAPISRIDLLLCRNALMYFNAEAQARILNRFNFALNPGGILCLGRAETLMTHSTSFEPVDLKRRISRKVGGHMAERPLPAPSPDARRDGEQESVSARLRTAAMDISPIAQLVVSDGRLSFFNARARTLFGLGPADVGRPLQDLELSYRPVELRSLIERAIADRRPVAMREVEWRSGEADARWYDVQVAVLPGDDGLVQGTGITFTDVTAFKRLQRELEQANQELETAYEELQSTNEELETTNEELQSTVEELETTNEELQSTNQELETMNEELQSTNEELQTINDEMRVRSDELNTANAFLESILSSVEGGVAVVDEELRLLAWNTQAEELWGVRAGEVIGRHLLNLDIGLPLDRLRPVLRGCIMSEGAPHAELEVDATNRRGKPIRCHITCSALKAPDDSVRGAIVMMREVPAT